MVLLPNNSWKNCNWFAEQLQLLHRTAAVVSLDKWPSNSCFSNKNCNYFINTFSRITAVCWSNNCSCLSKQVQLFGRANADVLLNNWQCAICRFDRNNPMNNYNMLIERLQLFDQTIATDWPTNCSSFANTLTEHLLFAHRTTAGLIGIIQRITTICWSNDCSCLIKQLRSVDWRTVILWANNCICGVEYLQ